MMSFEKPVVMAILNVTPDSFYAGSRRLEASDGELERAVERMIEQGAGIVDVGGYSSRPGAAQVSSEEELRRVKRGVEATRRVSSDVTISIDTFRASVAREFEGCIINDISAGELDPAMIPTVARMGAPYIAMHMRGRPENMQQHTDYQDFMDEVLQYFTVKIEQLAEAGIARIILDPGFGFAKTVEQNYELLANLHRLCDMGYPVLSGVSRKSMIYKPLGITPADALPATCALNWESLRQGASILRVHDVGEAAQIISIYQCYRENFCSLL